MKIAVLDDYQNVARDMADWSGLEREHEITFFPDIYEGLDGFARRLEPFDILCIMRERSPIGRDLIERLPNAKLFVTAGMRNAAIDFDACRERGIPVLGTGGSAQATPELAWGLMLSLARNIHIENARMREGAWITTLGIDMQFRNIERTSFDSRRLSWTGDTPRLIGELTCPVKVIYGEHDAAAIPSIAKRFEMCRATRPDIETHIIPACGHWALYEAPDIVNALLLDFHGRPHE